MNYTDKPYLPPEICTKILKFTDLYTCLALFEFEAAQHFLAKRDLVNEAFISAAQEGKVHKLKLLLSHIKIPSPKFILEEAAAAGHMEILLWLEDNGEQYWMDYDLDYSLAACNYYMSFHQGFVRAAENGHTQVVQYILGRGINLSANTLKSARKAAVERGHMSTLIILHERHVDEHEREQHRWCH